MRCTKPLTHNRSIHLYLVLGFSIIFIAALMGTSAPAKVAKRDAPAPNASHPQSTSDPCTPTPGVTPPPQLCGKWDEQLIGLQSVPVHINVLPNGKVLYWGRDKAFEHGGADHWDVGDKSNTYLWDPATGAGIGFTNHTTNLFCSGHSFLPDGRLLVTGGHSRHTTDLSQEGIGETDVNVFDYRTNSWTLIGSMEKGRWYPTNVTLGSGDTVVMSGLHGNRTGAPNVNLNEFVDLIKPNGQIQRYQTTNPTGIKLYPYLHLAGNQVFVAGPGPTSSWFTPIGTGMFGDGPDVDSHNHHDGATVMYEGGKVLTIGGNSGQPGEDPPNLKTVHSINLNSGFTWIEVASMNLNRKYHNATVLPDGKVLVTGGTQCSSGPAIDCIKEGGINKGAARQPELWSPALNTWTLLAPSLERPNYPVGIPRSYHSVAILLPDARVLVGGGGRPAAGGEVVNNQTCQDFTLDNAECLKFGHKDAEIFSPPYLFDSNGNAAVQPVISSAPDYISYGERFNVGTSNASSISSVVLIRLPSVTHGMNFDQRRVVLQKQVTSSTNLSVTMVANPNDCPPGPYMLFILDSNGVPSKAKIVTLPRYEGKIEAINCDQIRGWAWDSTNPNTSINVTLTFATSQSGSPIPSVTVPANLFRQDLLDMSKGNGFHGFAWNVPLSMKDGRTSLVNGIFTGTTLNVPRHIVGSLMCPASLFPTQTPTGTASGEGQTWEQGTEFSTSVSDGTITHVAFYKAPGETGSHFGRIWSDTGGKLREQQFLNETPSGWQVQALSSPLPISAGVKYRVTYNINNVVAKSFAALNSPITNGPLTAHTSYFSTPAGTFPTTNSGSILFADIRFTRRTAIR